MFKWLFGNKLCSISIYMKSGSVIVLDAVDDFEFSSKPGGGITRMVLAQHSKAKNRMLVKTIELDQIEAVVRHG